MPETATKPRETLHRLVDELPEPDLETAVRLLEALRATDPVLRALMNAPEDDEPMSDEERAAIEEAMEDVRAGNIVSDEELRRELDI